MIKINEYLKITDAAKFLGVTSNGLRVLEKEGKIKVRRNPLNGYRLYVREELEELLRNIAESIK